MSTSLKFAQLKFAQLVILNLGIFKKKSSSLKNGADSPEAALKTPRAGANIGAFFINAVENFIACIATPATLPRT